MPRVETVFRHAAALWLPFLVASETLGRSEIVVPLSRPGALDLMAFGTVLKLSGASDVISVSGSGEAIAVQWGDRDRVFSADELMGDHPEVHSCPRLGSEGPVVWSENPWLFDFAPYGGRFSARRFVPGGSLRGAVDRVLETVREVWPEAASLIDERVDVIVACASSGDFGAAPGWPHLIALHEATPSALVAAVSADRFFRASTVMDWLDNHPEERFDHAGRPRKIAWALARLYVEAQTAELGRRLGSSEPSPREEVRALRAALAERGQFTAGGRVLFETLSRRLHGSYTA